jgi:hypothetical protein
MVTSLRSGLTWFGSHTRTKEHFFVQSVHSCCLATRCIQFVLVVFCVELWGLCLPLAFAFLVCVVDIDIQQVHHTDNTHKHEAL